MIQFGLINCFSNNVTPILYIETLGDIEKTRARLSKEQLVRVIASKTPERNVYPNIFHS